MEINWTIVIVVIICFVAADKILTIANINAVEKNFPEVNALDIEKNPVAKYFFKQFGLYGGSIIYFFLTLITLFLFFLLLTWSLNLASVSNSSSISLYVIFIIYGFVIFNNIFMLLKFSKVIP